MSTRPFACQCAANGRLVPKEFTAPGSFCVRETELGNSLLQTISVEMSICFVGSGATPTAIARAIIPSMRPVGLRLPGDVRERNTDERTPYELWVKQGLQTPIGRSSKRSGSIDALVALSMALAVVNKVKPEVDIEALIG
jgi:hypothetical protein